MMKVFGSILVTLAVLAVCGVAYVVETGLSARPSPGALETRVMRTVRRLAVPGSIRDRANPAPADEASMADAMEHYADHCATCHGNDGSGTAEIGRGLYPKPPDMRLPPTQALTDGELFSIIEHGVRFTGMPAFGDGSATSEAASWTLVRFLRRLPTLTGDQLERMKAMNPRPPAEIRREIEEERFLQEQ